MKILEIILLEYQREKELEKLMATRSQLVDQLQNKFQMPIENILEKLEDSDPTDPNFKYTPWLIKVAAFDDFGDINDHQNLIKIYQSLDLFKQLQLKPQTRIDINQLKSITELIDWIEGLAGSKLAQFNKIYEDPTVSITEILNYPAALKVAKSTDWCIKNFETYEKNYHPSKGRLFFVNLKNPPLQAWYKILIFLNYFDEFSEIANQQNQPIKLKSLFEMEPNLIEPLAKIKFGEDGINEIVDLDPTSDKKFKIWLLREILLDTVNLKVTDQLRDYDRLLQTDFKTRSFSNIMQYSAKNLGEVIADLKEIYL